MNGNDYQALAWQTAKPFYKCETEGESFRQLQLCNMTLALCGEAGEMANKLKKFIENGTGIDHTERDILIEELGDVLWYCAGVASILSIKLEDVLGQNVAKLRERYKDQLSHRR